MGPKHLSCFWKFVFSWNRDTAIYLQGFVFPAQGARQHTTEVWHGRCWMMMTPFSALHSFSWIGPLWLDRCSRYKEFHVSVVSVIFIDERSLPSFLLGSSKKAANFETRLCARTCSHTLKPPMSWRWIQSLGLDQFWYYEAMSYLSGWSFSLSTSCPATSYAFHARTLISKRTPTLWPVYYKLLRVFLSSDHEVELLNCILFESAAYCQCPAYTESSWRQIDCAGHTQKLWSNFTAWLCITYFTTSGWFFPSVTWGKNRLNRWGMCMEIWKFFPKIVTYSKTSIKICSPFKLWCMSVVSGLMYKLVGGYILMPVTFVNFIFLHRISDKWW